MQLVTLFGVVVRFGRIGTARPHLPRSDKIGMSTNSLGPTLAWLGFGAAISAATSAAATNATQSFMILTMVVLLLTAILAEWPMALPYSQAKRASFQISFALGSLAFLVGISVRFVLPIISVAKT